MHAPVDTAVTYFFVPAHHRTGMYGAATRVQFWPLHSVTHVPFGGGLILTDGRCLGTSALSSSRVHAYRFPLIRPPSREFSPGALCVLQECGCTRNEGMVQARTTYTRVLGVGNAGPSASAHADAARVADRRPVKGRRHTEYEVLDIPNTGLRNQRG